MWVFFVMALLPWVQSELCPLVPCPQNSVNCTLFVGHLGAHGNSVIHGHQRVHGSLEGADAHFHGRVSINTTGSVVPLSISRYSHRPKITFWTGGSVEDHTGIGVSSNRQLNYHVYDSLHDHVFYAGGTNGDGQELFRISGEGRLSLLNVTRTARLNVPGEGTPGAGEMSNHAIRIQGTRNSLVMGSHRDRGNYLQGWQDGTGRHAPLLLNPAGGAVVMGTDTLTESDQRLFVNGNMKVNGVVTASSVQSSSSRQWKENIVPLQHAFHVLNKLRPVEYTWKQGYGDHLPESPFPPQVQRGFIAEEVASVFPGAVNHPESPTSVDYTKIVPLLVAAVQELAERVKVLEGREGSPVPL